MMHSRDRIVVSTLRFGRNNPGSNPGHGIFIFEKGCPVWFDGDSRGRYSWVNVD